MENSATVVASQSAITQAESVKHIKQALLSLEQSWVAKFRFSPVEGTLVIKDDGLFFGSTKLAPCLHGHETQIYALVSFAIGSAAPSSLLKTVEATLVDYVAGDKAMSAMRLALAFPTPPGDHDNYRKLHIAAGLLDAGHLAPHEMLSLTETGSGQLEIVAKYSPDQPRVPAGSRDGGHWTGDNSSILISDRQAMMGEGCAGEWAWALQHCEQLLALPNPPRSQTGGHNTARGCAVGFVSERCGGNKV